MSLYDPLPLFPELPKNMDLGKPISEFIPRYYFHGDFHSDDCFTIDFIQSKRLRVSIYEYGLKIEEVESFSEEFSTKPKLELHYSTLISVNKANLTELYTYKEKEHEEIPLSEKIFCSQPFDFSDKESILKYAGSIWDKKTILVVNFWNVDYKQPNSFIIHGRKAKISGFIHTIEKALSNYKNGIPNVPKSRADTIFLTIFTGILIAFICTIIVSFVRNIFF